MWPQVSRQEVGPISSALGGALLRTAYRTAMALAFPPHCVVCQESCTGETLCRRCAEQLVDRGEFCPRCARPLPEYWPEISAGCPRCQVSRYPFGQATTLGVYTGPLRNAVLRMKQGDEALAIGLGRLLARRLEDQLWVKPNIMTTVPTHWTRRLLRGMHPPELVGSGVADILGIRLTRNLLTCRRKTKKQGTLQPSERRKNVRGAYAISRGYDIRGKQVLVIDDVMTSGSTLIEVSQVLRRQGVASISVAVVARGVGLNC